MFIKLATGLKRGCGWKGTYKSMKTGTPRLTIVHISLSNYNQEINYLIVFVKLLFTSFLFQWRNLSMAKSLAVYLLPRLTALTISSAGFG